MPTDPAGPTSPVAPRPQIPLLTKLTDQNTFGHGHAAETSETSQDSRATFSYPDSRASTPDSAAPLEVNFRKADVDSAWNEKPENAAAAHAALGVDDDTLLLVGAAGRQPEEVYTRTMSWWRAAIRRAILRNVEWESAVLAKMQVCVVLCPLLGRSVLRRRTYQLTVLRGRPECAIPSWMRTSCIRPRWARIRSS